MKVTVQAGRTVPCPPPYKNRRRAAETSASLRRAQSSRSVEPCAPYRVNSNDVAVSISAEGARCGSGLGDSNQWEAEAGAGAGGERGYGAQWAGRGGWIAVRFASMSESKEMDNSPENLANLPFEEALKRLEAIVESMESSQMPLETLLARYQEGAALARLCQAKLNEADLKIQQLERNSKGEMVLKPLQMQEDKL